MTEALEKASQTLDLATRDLREALATCGPVEALVVLPLVAQVAQARQSVDALLAAKREEGAGRG